MEVFLCINYYVIKKIIKNIIFIWLIKITSFIFESQTKNQTK